MKRLIPALIAIAALAVPATASAARRLPDIPVYGTNSNGRITNITAQSIRPVFDRLSHSWVRGKSAALFVGYWVAVTGQTTMNFPDQIMPTRWNWTMKVYPHDATAGIYRWHYHVDSWSFTGATRVVATAPGGQVVRFQLVESFGW
jgi:hypothetical protein